ncbi:claudin-8-like [Misgurnus anguillicaudatus]|uniref:claudin-8-like n=1 Tax=Misgurnus anguillicaudatus TaxID=75329 RepID=UPI003CCF0261
MAKTLPSHSYQIQMYIKTSMCSLLLFYAFNNSCRNGRCAIMKGKLEILAMALGIIGLVGTIATALMPMWKVSAFIGPNLIVMETQWQGLWMACIRQADINMQCKVYDSLLILPADIQAARGLMCTAIMLAFLAVLVSIIGMSGTNSCNNNIRGKNVIQVVGGCLFIVASLATLIPVAWSTHTIVRNFYNPAVVESQKFEIGQSLYVGFATFILLVVAGVILFFRYASHQTKEEEDYIPGREKKAGMPMLERTPSGSYKKSQYV